MILLRPYSSINDFLQRFTILKIGKFHVRLHKITDNDRSTLFHNHPFNYVSVILKGGYTERVIKKDRTMTKKHKVGSIIFRSRNVFHRIDTIQGREAVTLFFAFGNFGWKAFSRNYNTDNDGMFQRVIKNKKVWSKRENGIWFIGNQDKAIAAKETRHSIHQVIQPITQI